MPVRLVGVIFPKNLSGQTKLVSEEWFFISIPPNLLGFVIMRHGYDYISLFVSFIDIPVSLGSLFQRIG